MDSCKPECLWKAHLFFRAASENNFVKRALAFNIMTLEKSNRLTSELSELRLSFSQGTVVHWFTSTKPPTT